MLAVQLERSAVTLHRAAAEVKHSWRAGNVCKQDAGLQRSRLSLCAATCLGSPSWSVQAFSPASGIGAISAQPQLAAASGKISTALTTSGSSQTECCSSLLLPNERASRLYLRAAG